MSLPESENTSAALRQENETLRLRLEEAEEMLHAISGGEVDALFIGDQVYTLESADAESNRFRGEVLAQINEVVISVDNDYRVTYMNPAAEKAYGASASESLGRKLEDLFRFEWASEEAALRSQESLESAGFWRGDNLHRKRDGSVVPVESNVTVLRDRSGERVGLFAVIRDISERKAAEKALRAAHDELERRVDERTAELAKANSSLKSEMQTREAIELQRKELLKKVVTSQEDERRRISREIHDQLGQRITALRMQIEAFADSMEGEPKFARRIETLKATAEGLDDEVGFLAWELRPASLDDLGLAEAAREFLKDWSSHYQISSEFNLRGFGDRRLRPETETHLYRIMQESLNNIVKHAQATHVSVLLEWGVKEIALIVEDNGTGFEPADDEARRTEPGKALGLLGMKERATLIGGYLEIESSRDFGTTIYARIPADEETNGHSPQSGGPPVRST